MLSDIERKVLRIIANYSAGRRRMPTIDELTNKTARDRAGVMAVLTVLDRAGYITWGRQKPDEIVLLRAWEMEDRPTWRSVDLER